jgi:hypothetical protein
MSSLCEKHGKTKYIATLRLLPISYVSCNHCWQPLKFAFDELLMFPREETRPAMEADELGLAVKRPRLACMILLPCNVISPSDVGNQDELPLSG